MKKKGSLVQKKEEDGLDGRNKMTMMGDKWRNGGKKVETSVRNRNDGRIREGDERERILK